MKKAFKKLLVNLALIALFVVVMMGVVNFVENFGNSAEETSMEIRSVEITILEQGEGDRVTQVGDTISVDYTGWLTDETKFDSSIDRGIPFTLTLGDSDVIEGWEEGLLGMKLGEKRRIYIPFEKAYGENGVSGLIPEKSDLIFEVELLEFK